MAAGTRKCVGDYLVGCCLLHTWVVTTRIGVKERILDPTKGAAHPSGSVSLFYTIGFISGVCLPRGTSQISCFLRSS